MYTKLVPLDETARPSGNNFDALRLAFALLVVWSHSFALHLGTERNEWLALLLNGVFNAGNVGVMAFFVISGLLITQSYVRSRSVSSFFGKRIRRILPGYLVATTISAFVMVVLFTSVRPHIWEFGRAIAMNLLLRNYSPIADDFHHYDGGLMMVNGALWSIPYEFWCYIGVAVLGIAGATTKRWFLVLLTAAVMLLHLGFDLAGSKGPGLGIVGEIVGWPYQWTKTLPSFLFGMIAFSFPIVRSRWLLAGLIGSAIIACHISSYVGGILVPPALAYAVLYLAFSDSISLHKAARFGDFSYGTYLYGFLIQKVLQKSNTADWTLAEFFFVSAVLALSAGILSWHLIEKWLLPRRIPDGPQADQPKASNEPLRAETARGRINRD